MTSLGRPLVNCVTLLSILRNGCKTIVNLVYLEMINCKRKFETNTFPKKYKFPCVIVIHLVSPYLNALNVLSERYNEVAQSDLISTIANAFSRFPPDHCDLFIVYEVPSLRISSAQTLTQCAPLHSHRPFFAQFRNAFI